MAITASLVKELRERSGAAMMDCKRALEATDGDIDAALEKMRVEGQAKADRKAGRVAADGAIGIVVSDDGRTAAMVEINSETDFVARRDEFQAFVKTVAAHIAESGNDDVAALVDSDIDTERKALITTLGENISLRRAVVEKSESGLITHYQHGLRIGVVVVMEGGDEDLARDIAMHIAASRPQFIAADDVPEEVRNNERRVLQAQAEDSGKPQEIVDKMIEGRLRKFLAEITLLGQPFVKDPDTTVEKLLKQHGATVTAFHRFEVGEGIEKEEANFADEVAAQASAASGAN